MLYIALFPLHSNTKTRLPVNINIFIGTKVFGRQMSCLTKSMLTQGKVCGKKHNCEPRSIEGPWELHIYHMRTSVRNADLFPLENGD